MSTPPPSRTGPVWHWLPWLASGVAGMLGAWAGWRFGNQVAGLWLAVIGAANCGVLFALLAGHGADRLVEWLRARR